MLSKLLRKRILKSIPIWLIILIISIPTAAAVALYLSNTIDQSITVVAMPITIDNGFDANMVSGSTHKNTFSYTVDASAVSVPALTTGYLQLTISGASVNPNLELTQVTVSPNVGGGATLVKSYEFIGTNTVTYCFGATSTTPYDFSPTTANGGTITMFWTIHNSAGASLHAYLEVVPQVPT